MQSGPSQLPNQDLTTNPPSDTDSEAQHGLQNSVILLRHGEGTQDDNGNGAGALPSEIAGEATCSETASVSRNELSNIEARHYGNVDDEQPPHMIETEALTTDLRRDFASISVHTAPDGHATHLKIRLQDLPNEVITHILSHLPPDAHTSVALVSKHFLALVKEPYAWSRGFLRYFRGHQDFTRLTPLASWRSEYLLRTRLLRSIARGRPGSTGVVGQSSRPGHSKRAPAILTYNSKLPWTISHIHAVFSTSKKPPRVIHGAANLGLATTSDPSIGKVDKWGLDESFMLAQLDEVFPGLEPYGTAEGPAATPNVLDVSQLYGRISGEGFPGGRAYLRAPNELRGRYLFQSSPVSENNQEMPRIPELTEAVTAVWIAKSSAVPTVSQNMIGLLVGSSMGVITSYAVGHDATGPRYSAGEMTAKWVISPGVPIISIAVDDSYNFRRQTQSRVWAVALNALGEAYYLTETPTPITKSNKADDTVEKAWHCGRTVQWQLVETTRRETHPDTLDKNAAKGSYTPRSSGERSQLSSAQRRAEAREIEEYFRHTPATFRRMCHGWDMRRDLLCDFASGSSEQAGESIFIISCGYDEASPPTLTRHTRDASTRSGHTSPSTVPANSIFGSATPGLSDVDDVVRDLSVWRTERLSMKGVGLAVISAAVLDNSLQALTTWSEDPLINFDGPNMDSVTSSKPIIRDVPGRRARLLALGLENGKIAIWNARSSTNLDPIRLIQTESPVITALACSAAIVVSGGSDGLVQAWDPLGSSEECFRTLSSKSSGRIPRHILNSNPLLHDADHAAVGAIYLDPDPVNLRGVVTLGTFVRYWDFDSSQSSGRKRRSRYNNGPGGPGAHRRGTVGGYIRGEMDELREDRHYQEREDSRLKRRFGVGLADLTEEQALQYAQLVSEEAFLAEEEYRRNSDATSLSNLDSSSSAGSYNTVTPEPSLSGVSSSFAGPSSSMSALGAGGVPQSDSEDDYEQQIQRALRLSLLEGVNDEGKSPSRSSSTTDLSYAINYKSSKKGKRSASKSPDSQVATPLPPQRAQSSTSQILVNPAAAAAAAVDVAPDERGVGSSFEDDLDLALRLSIAEAESQQEQQRLSGSAGVVADEVEEDFPALEVKGKGKGVVRSKRM